MLEELVRIALTEDVSATRLAILRQIALIINKFLPARNTHLASDILWRPGRGLLSADNLSESSVRVIFWIARALILRLINTDKILDQLLKLLNHPSYGSVSARGFSLLLAPDEVLTKENGVTIRLLAKQKVFNICATSIPPLFRSADPTAKPNYLIALSGLLRYVSSDVLMSEIEILLPLLLQSVELEDAEVKLATIETLTVIAHENPKAVEGHISSLIGRLLKAATEPHRNIPVSHPIPIPRVCLDGCSSWFPFIESSVCLAPLSTHLPRQSEGQRAPAVRESGDKGSDGRAGRSEAGRAKGSGGLSVEVVGFG